MKILLAAVNAKYTHMNPALYSIKAFAGDAGKCFEIAEYTINQYPRDVLKDIHERQPQVIGFSCYIWNMSFVEELLCDIKKILPGVQVFLGGPEVSFNVNVVLERYPDVDGVFAGEGEEAWKEAALQFMEHGRLVKGIEGLQLKSQNLPRTLEAICPLNLDDIPFIFDDISIFDNRMLYYETSRGCPFRCAYCLSSIEKTLRFRSLEKVYPELQFFLDKEVRIVKFIDRTFNADKRHAMGIWKYLAEHDNGISRFHFEIEADILSDEEIEFLSGVRKGLFQFEIGVQSTNSQALGAVNRKSSVQKIKDAVIRLKKAGNIPLHVDLIAGLPFEDMKSFKASFNEVYSWRADELQLGFLKVLHGTEIEKRAGEYGLIYGSRPPYEVISTKWVDFDDILRLKDVEEQLERYGNSGAFSHTLKIFEDYFDTPFEMYEYIALFYKENSDRFSKQSRISTYEMLRKMIRKRLEGSPSLANAFDSLLLLDLYEKEKLKARPAFFGNEAEQRKMEREFIKQRAIKGNVHAEFFGYDAEIFAKEGKLKAGPSAICFEYEGQGAATHITFTHFILDA